MQNTRRSDDAFFIARGILRKVSPPRIKMYAPEFEHTKKPNSISRTGFIIHVHASDLFKAHGRTHARAVVINCEVTTNN